MPGDDAKNKKKKLYQIISIVIVLIAIATPFIYGHFQSKEYYKMLTQNSTITQGTITGFSHPYKRSLRIEYLFELNGIPYTGKSSGQRSDYVKFIKHFRGAIEGQTFPVLVNKEKPKEYSVILITPNDFKQYNIDYPDSLHKIKWILR